MTIPDTIKTKDFGDIKVHENADWERLSMEEDIGFPAGDHLNCYIYMEPTGLGYYITTAYGSHRQLETGKL